MIGLLLQALFFIAFPAGRPYRRGMSVPIVSFIARGSLSGKTTVIERVIAEFVRRGKRVTALKHGIHMHRLDKEGKDSYRFAQQGASRVMMFSDEGFLLYEYAEPKVEDLIALAARDMDIVLIEGFKSGPFKKIEVFNAQRYEKALYEEDPRPDIIAMVSSKPLDLPIPCLGFDDIERLCDLIESTVATQL